MYHSHAFVRVFGPKVHTDLAAKEENKCCRFNHSNPHFL